MKPIPERYELAKAESVWRARWAANEVFKWDPTLPPETDYVIDTPPPTVSGTLHIGHIYSYTQADIIARYFRMSGRNVLYPIGWDDNGLPTERLVEKVKKVRGSAMNRDAFVALCREVIPAYEDQFRELFSRLALSVDWSREYQTISDESRTISQLSFLDLYKKGLLERRLEPTLWDPADRTAIAQAEVDEVERDGTLNHIVFRFEGGGEAIVATTRPELLGGCGALMIHPDDTRAKDLVGKRAISPLYNVLVPIIADERVDPEKGTGLVMCCTFGDVTDIHWWRKHDLPLRMVMDQAGVMLPEIPIGGEAWPSVDLESARVTMEALKGLKPEKARAVILERLADHGLLKEQVTTRQVVPVAERSGAALEIIVASQWFIKTLDYRDALLACGRSIVWRPASMRQRFETWVEGLKWDWSISRQRHFGVPLPVWYSKRPGEEGRVLIPSVQELPVDPTVDLPAGYSADEIERETDVMDTWATSSVTPQLVTRTINDEFGLDHPAHRRLFPMALRPQAHEIIRTWAFYTMVKALHHEHTVPWRNIAISGWCLASDGTKMSKSRGNVIDPVRLLDEHGSDVVRYWTGTSRLGQDTVLSPNTLQQGKRLVTKLWNAIKLAHISLSRADVRPTTPKSDIARGLITHPLDTWLLGRISEIVSQSTQAFDVYEYAQALRITEDFFWRTYCDNYLEMVKVRTRFDSEPTAQERSALLTLYHASAVLIRLFAPFLPYITETLNDVLDGMVDQEVLTVHARNQWPKSADQADVTMSRNLGDAFVAIVAAGRKVKSELAVSLRAPVSTVTISSKVASLNVTDVKILMREVEEDLKAVLNAERIRWADAAPQGEPAAASPDGRLAIALCMAAPTESGAGRREPAPSGTSET